MLSSAGAPAGARIIDLAAFRRSGRLVPPVTLVPVAPAKQSAGIAIGDPIFDFESGCTGSIVALFDGAPAARVHIQFPWGRRSVFVTQIDMWRGLRMGLVTYPLPAEAPAQAPIIDLPCDVELPAPVEASPAQLAVALAVAEESRS